MAFTQASVTHQLPTPSILQQRFLLALPTDGHSLPLNVEIGWMSALAGGRQP